MATDMVANATNIFSLATKKSGLVATLAIRFLYNLDLNDLDLKQTFHLILLCFQSEITPYTCITMMCSASFTLYKLATKDLHLAKRRPEDFFNFEACKDLLPILWRYSMIDSQNGSHVQPCTCRKWNRDDWFLTPWYFFLGFFWTSGFNFPHGIVIYFTY